MSLKNFGQLVVLGFLLTSLKEDLWLSTQKSHFIMDGRGEGLSPVTQHQPAEHSDIVWWRKCGCEGVFPGALQERAGTPVILEPFFPNVVLPLFINIVYIF